MTYRPDHLRALRLAGSALRAFTIAAEAPLIGRPLRRSMLKAAGIPAFRKIVSNDVPVVVPPLPGVADVDDTRPVERSTSAGPSPRELPFETAANFATAYRAGSTNPLDVAERFLDAADQAERAVPPLRAFIAIDRDDVLEQARASADRARRAQTLGPLDGVPVAVKDELDQVPYPTTVGTRFLGRAPAASDATVVARLRRAGAMLVGKTNMHEVGLGITGVNPHHGTPRNPYDPTRITGGSSSGSAAAVAAGLCPVALAADAGGSIRIPAALCGVVGLKPTFGRISERGAATVCWSIAHIGLIGATARDVALAYHAIAGPDELDPSTRRQPPIRVETFGGRDLCGVTIGVYRPWFEDADEAVVTTCRRALDQLAGAGATLREIEIGELHLVRPVHFVTAACEWAAAFARQYATNRRAFGLDVRLTLLLAQSLGGADYVHAQRLRRRVCDRFRDALGEVDVIATPTTAGIAPPVSRDALATGESDFVTLDRMTRFVLAANLTGLPAISFPCGYDPSGLPIGMQLIARPWREDVLLRITHFAESVIERRAPSSPAGSSGTPAEQTPAKETHPRGSRPNHLLADGL